MFAINNFKFLVTNWLFFNTNFTLWHLYKIKKMVFKFQNVIIANWFCVSFCFFFFTSGFLFVNFVFFFGKSFKERKTTNPIFIIKNKTSSRREIEKKETQWKTYCHYCCCCKKEEKRKTVEKHHFHFCLHQILRQYWHLLVTPA